MDATAFFQVLTGIFGFLPPLSGKVVVDPSGIILVAAWLVAGVVSLYFTINNSRIWTSVSVGFFLLVWAQSFQINPWAEMFPSLVAIHYTVGTIAIIVVSYGIQEYYFFTRTLEVSGQKNRIYYATAALIGCASLMIVVNPEPTQFVLRNYRLANNIVWVLLCLVNIVTVARIYREIDSSPIAKGILGLGIVFLFSLIWKGSSLYLIMYQWDKDWMMIAKAAGVASLLPDIASHTYRIEFAKSVFRSFNILTSMSVMASFLYLLRLMTR